MGVSRFSRYSASYGSNGSSGAPSASDTFTLSQNSLVVVIALAAGQQSIRLNGIPGLHMNASSSEPEAMVIGHAHLVPGEYTITERSAALAGGQDPNHMADLVGVFVFQ